MIEVTNNALLSICDKLSIDREKLTFLGGGRGDSDGVVYTYMSEKGKMVLKILAIPEKETEKLRSLEARVHYANYLGENGIKLAHPIRNKNENLYEVCIDNGHYYAAYCMKFCEGRSPESKEITSKLAQEWGKITGVSHRITKTYTNEINEDNFSYKKELDFFKNWCQEQEVKALWEEMDKYLVNLPCGKDEYGFIHNDNHQMNILVLGKDITLIDFDCAEKQFFIQDITTPAQGLMFDITGGMVSPLKEEERLKQFFDSFINGYEKENHLTDFWYKEMPTFLNYRRMLLFTCMQDWLNENLELKRNFIENIKNSPKIF